MAKQIRNRSKIEQYGLVNEALRLKQEGNGGIKIARALSAICGKKVNSTNVSAFFNKLNNTMEDNSMLQESVENNIATTNLKMLNNWKAMDDDLAQLREEAKEDLDKCIGFKRDTGEPIIVKERDRKLHLDIIDKIAKISDIRAKQLGQMTQGGNKIFINKVEIQYDNLKGMLAEAEESFPGLNEWIEGRMMDKAAEEAKPVGFQKAEPADEDNKDNKEEEVEPVGKDL